MNSFTDVFNEFSQQHNQQFKLRDLLAFLDSKCQNGYFDRDVFQQLIDQIPGAQSQQQCTINQLIYVMKKAYEVLNDKINKGQQIIDQRNIELRAYQDKLRQSQTSSLTNTNKLNIEILDAEIFYQGSGQLQVSVECMTTVNYPVDKNLNGMNALNCIQSKIFSNANESAILKFILLDTELLQKRGLGGVAYLDINTFNDQMLHDIHVNLTDESNSVIRAKLHIKVQWIHSKNKYLIDLINENTVQINLLEQELNDHVIDLEIIAQPFRQELKVPNVGISTYQSQPNQQQQLLYQSQNGAQSIDERQIDRLVQISLLLTILYLIIGLLNSIYRTIYLDYIVIFYCFLFYQKNFRLQSLLHIKIIMAMLIVALIQDIVWLAIYSTPYLGEFNPHYDHLEYGIQKYQVILSGLLLLCKIIVLIFYVHIYSTYPDKQTQIYDQQWQSIFGLKQGREINVYRNYY
ncbi:unnamed protein product (macronuclear) [Paramecium tetraurelia]|uniref:Transmembrane protein n=1 Tax=Paramecium tetraurelia TaxID=5888 RepID=A0DE70_PARTE|nr:uncharacterized protein GSPATT00016179001 [Paramecium tetraurelia]CAK81337.1 unnamed protein product [Paramecium tetraurelia]|eukprot:XP_001448734.1 hypothetical protein (macronuclear) [Paramecium tetraurelia strain d4-2]